MTYFVYILLCSDNTYYVGVTNNLKRRLREHETGYNPGSYTSKRLPVSLAYHDIFQYINDAIAFEKKIKKWSQAKKQALIASRLELLPELAKKKFIK